METGGEEHEGEKALLAEGFAKIGTDNAGDVLYQKPGTTEFRVLKASTFAEPAADPAKTYTKTEVDDLVKAATKDLSEKLDKLVEAADPAGKVKMVLVPRPGDPVSVAKANGSSPIPLD
jgi:hypothetical protein